MDNQNCNCNSNRENSYYEKLYVILNKYTNDESNLIPILQMVQEAYGYLPQDVMEKLCEVTGLFPSQVMGVATFYSQFRLKAAGENIIKLCFGTACHVNGAEKIGEALEDELKIKIGETSKDGKFTLETVACLGCCSLAPVMMIGNEAYGRLTPDSARKIIRDFSLGGQA
jgi:NADH-quinone oxidoreductase subunit E